MARIQRERRTKTLMYVIFIFAAGAGVAPLIFGFVTEIGGLVANVGSDVVVNNPLNIPGTSINIFWVYLVIQTFISGVMLAVVRGIRIWKGIVFYSLSMVLIGTIVLEVSKLIARSLLPAAM
jgi:archaellum biogenesis protein FlaJ (TadC family)